MVVILFSDIFCLQRVLGPLGATLGPFTLKGAQHWFRSQPNPSVMEKQEINVLKAEEIRVFALSGTTMTTNAGELQKWIKAYNEDPRLRSMVEKLRQ